MVSFKFFSACTRQARLQLVLDLLSQLEKGERQLQVLTEDQQNSIYRRNTSSEELLRRKHEVSSKKLRLDEADQVSRVFHEIENTRANNSLYQAHYILWMISAAFEYKDSQLARALLLADNYSEAFQSNCSGRVKILSGYNCIAKRGSTAVRTFENREFYHNATAARPVYQYFESGSAHMSSLHMKSVSNAKSLTAFDKQVLAAKQQLTADGFDKDAAITALQIEVSALLVLSSTTKFTRWFFDKYTYMERVYNFLESCPQLADKTKCFEILLELAKTPRMDKSSLQNIFRRLGAVTQENARYPLPPVYSRTASSTTPQQPGPQTTSAKNINRYESVVIGFYKPSFEEGSSPVCVSTSEVEPSAPKYETMRFARSRG